MMGVRRLQYGQELEKETRKPGTLETAHRKAAERSKVKPVKEKESWVKKLKRKSHELLKGEKAYISKERAGEMKAARKAKKGKKKSALKHYSEESKSPSFKGASGSDLAELQKRFGKKGR